MRSLARIQATRQVHNMARFLMIRLTSPLIAFGGETIDSFGVTREFPALSMMTGLFANALGWDRGEAGRHDRLQSRLRIGTRIEHAGERMTDFQTAQLGAADRGWTTFGVPEARRGGAGSYDSPHLRYRDYHADLTATVAVRLVPDGEAPTLDDLQGALDRPQRPLFIGRKPCLPSTRLFIGFAEADTLLSALQSTQSVNHVALMQWPEGEGEWPGDRCFEICDERNWVSGFHGGLRPVRECLVQGTGLPG
jgi:CRISPR system Cascade subunit CasD